MNASSDNTARAALGIGDPAPPLTLGKFLKGSPITELVPQAIHVVEFWATWCGPCIAAMPHLTELAKQYPDVSFLSVNVWESDPSLVLPFVQKKGDKIGYTVAQDLVPEGVSGREGAMAKSWLGAAEQKSIPSAFIVDTNGRIAWIGHPMALDGPLSEIASGGWDTIAAAEEHSEALEWSRRQTAFHQAMRAAEEAKDYAQVVILIDEQVALNPQNLRQYAPQRLAALWQSGDKEQAVAFGDRIVDELYRNFAYPLAHVAVTLVKVTEEAERDAEVTGLIHRITNRVEELSSEKDFYAVHTLASVYAAQGDRSQAVKAQTQALDWVQEARAAGEDIDDNDIAEIEEQLQQYRRAGMTADEPPLS